MEVQESLFLDVIFCISLNIGWLYSVNYFKTGITEHGYYDEVIRDRKKSGYSQVLLIFFFFYYLSRYNYIYYSFQREQKLFPFKEYSVIKRFHFHNFSGPLLNSVKVIIIIIINDWPFGLGILWIGLFFH